MATLQADAIYIILATYELVLIFIDIFRVVHPIKNLAIKISSL